jgi:Type I phosphodiesterase / nucleotide pyrophosphatase
MVGALACLAALVPAGEASAKKPIVYVVVIDALDGNSVEAGKTPFISSLLAGEGSNGAYFPQSRSVIPAETNPNHTAMMTGALPSKSGIPANTFAIYAPLADENSCAATGPFDTSILPSETSGESPTCPQAETVFEAIRRQGGKRRPTTSVIMGKPKLGRIFDVTYRGNRAADHIWAPCTTETTEDDGYCESVPTNPITGYAANDQIVMDEVLETAEEGIEVRGRTRRPDFTFVNLPQVDSAGHAFGTVLPAYDVATLQADIEIERLGTVLRERGEWDRTTLMIVSDHSMDTVPQKVNLTSVMTEGGVPEDDFVALNNEGSVDFLYLADRTAPRAERDELLATMRDLALAEPGVAEVMYRKPNKADGGRAHTIRTTHPSWARGKRVGDLFATAEPGFGFTEPGLTNNPVPGNHGAPQTADNFMSVVGGWPKIKTGTVGGDSKRARIRNNDVAATVMRLFGLKAPKKSTGRPIKAAFRSGTLRR